MSILDLDAAALRLLANIQAQTDIPAITLPDGKLDVPPTGLMVIDISGTPDIESTTLSPLTYCLIQPAWVHCHANADPLVRGDQVLAMRQAVNAAVIADRTLDGLIDDIQPMEPSAQAQGPVAGNFGLAQATIYLGFHYQTDTLI